MKIPNMDVCLKPALVSFYIQLAFLPIFLGFVDYHHEADASDQHNSVHYVFGGNRPESNIINVYYNLFQDVHVMIYIGFGFLMTFLKRYGFSAVGFNFLLASLIVQWALICEGFYDMEDNKIKISIVSLLRADVAAATVLITMGALLGRTSYIQLLLIGIIEIAVFTGNSYLGSHIFKVTDAGDSIFVHAFGAYFGLAVSYVLARRTKEWTEANPMEGSSYTSDLFAMIGTVFLWMFWPSFNSAEQTGDDQQRAVINTYLSLCACCVTSYAMSAMLTSEHKFDMVHIQNSTLAGGVAIGTAANLMVQPWGAMLIGCIAGIISVCGYSMLTPWIDSKLKIHDTCGVHNLHGMPAVLAALVGALMAGLASEDQYKMSLYQIFPAMAAVDAKATAEYPFLQPGDGRTNLTQAGFQLAAIAATIAIAIVSGAITGLIVSSLGVSPKSGYADDQFWLIHEPHSEHSSHEGTLKLETVSETIDKSSPIGKRLAQGRETDEDFY
ncbi:ammonium transporter Rh type A isoform X3 [Atheta coriaria]|uniref:ammonium transporter Rh type A isoform X3 n=1 Tax=Dalotia coriaria TaxID=877792 RepID=UPI0031F45933